MKFSIIKKHLSIILIFVIIAISQSCDLIKLEREHRKKRKALQSKIDTLKMNHQEILDDLERIEELLEETENIDSVLSNIDTSQIKIIETVN
jgi:cell division protein ZapA (FtsZ GTPase activity inhibitor)